MDGMPLVYSGQEAGLARSLKFFDKDPIDWKPDTLTGIFTRLFQLKRTNQALWNGKWGGEMVRIKNDKMSQLLSFVREKNGDKVITIVNLSDKEITATLQTQFDKGTYTDLFTNASFTLQGNDKITLPAWSYKVLFASTHSN